MRKILTIVLILFAFYDVSFATDACDKLIPEEASFIGEATMSARLRDYPCTYKSNVLGASTIGDTYTIIQKVDGWYRIESDLGDSVRIWDQAITKVDDLVIESEDNSTLSIKDKAIVNKLFNALEEIILEKGVDFRDKLTARIDNLLLDDDLEDRIVNILKELNTRLKDIEVYTEEEELDFDYSGNYLSQYSIDLDEVKETWLSWYNEVRENLGKQDYIYNSTLEQSAITWSNTSKQRGEITHKRDSGDSYYDYDKITEWFADNGVVCENKYGVTHTENIGWGTFVCNDSDCTDEFLEGIESTFDFYMSEIYDSYQPHYKSIINDYFTEIGIGFAIEQTNNNYYKYYLTVHYCTKLEK